MPRLDLAQSFLGIDAIFVVPCDARRVIFFDISGKRLEYPVERLYPFSVGAVPLSIVRTYQHAPGSYSLVFVFLHDTIPIKLCTAQHICYIVKRLWFNSDPSKHCNAFRDHCEMVEERRRPVSDSNVVNNSDRRL